MKLSKIDNSSLFPRTIDELFHQFWAEPLAKSGATQFAPPIDVSETEDAFLVTAELPGVAADDVDLTVGADTLTLKGEKKSEKVEDVSGHITERRYGTFTRTFTFPTQISSEDVVAEARDGVLRVTVKKAEAAKIRKIEIRPQES